MRSLNLLNNIGRGERSSRMRYTPGWRPSGGRNAARGGRNPSPMGG